MCAAFCVKSHACTGIALTARDGSRIVGRTVEWASSTLECGYIISPRGQKFRSMTPEGDNGVSYTSKYGFAGIYTDNPAFIVEGLNEKGLSAGLFFFPGYGEYPEYNPKHSSKSLCDMQFVSWALSQCATIDEVKAAVAKLDVVALDERAGTVHWRISEPGGRVVVLEYTGGQAHFYENSLGVLANSPGFEWQMTNLSNYVNLSPGTAAALSMSGDVTVRSAGGGSGMLGLPGDFTPPSRFVRAAFLQSTAPEQADGHDASMMAFHLLNHFDVPLGMQTAPGAAPEDLQSATQFTSVSDLTSLKLYYRTAWNSDLRCLDLTTVDFSTAKYQTAPLDPVKTQPVEYLRIN